MIIERIMAYKEGYLPTSRHRKERFREVEGLFTAELSEISTADPYCEAYLVFRVHDYEVHAEGIQVTDYRMYDGQLYRPSLRGRYFNCNDAEYRLPVLGSEIADKLHVLCSRDFSKSEVAMKYQEEADRYLIIDGVVWEKASEPFYYVETFGLGNNHGGTSLLIDRNGRCTDYYHTYSALQREEAVNAAIQVALDRGDTDAVPCLQKNDRYIEVINPDVVHFQRKLRTFVVEKITVGAVAVKAVNYARALDLAKQLPASCYNVGHESYRNSRTVENASVFYTEEDVKALTGQPQEKTNPSLSDMKAIAEDIVKALESRSFNDCTDSSGYIVIREFGDEVDRAVDVYKSDGDGKDIPHYVIYCSYEDGNSDYAYTADLSVEGLTKVLEEFYNTPMEDGSETEASEPVVATEPRSALEISKMLTISTAHVTEDICERLAARADHDPRYNIPFVVYRKDEFGYFIYVTKDTLEDALKEGSCPEVLLDVVKFAVKHGCKLLCLDRDGPTVPELKTHEW